MCRESRAGVWAQGRSEEKLADKKKSKYSRYARENKCRFCRENVEHIDYKDVDTLSKLVTAQGKMFGRKRSGNCARHQRMVRRAVKRARTVALLPYVG